MRRSFEERPALKAARDLLLRIEEVAEGASFEDWELDEFEKRWMLTPAVFWEYATIAGEDHADFEDRLRDAIGSFKDIHAIAERASQRAGAKVRRNWHVLLARPSR